MSEPRVIVDGEWLHPVGDLEITDRWPGGNWSVDWSMNLAPGQKPPALRAGAPVKVMYGSHPRWGGTLADPDWDSGTFHADGRCMQAQTVLAEDNNGEPVVAPAWALLYANNRGALDWFHWGEPFADGTEDEPTDVNTMWDLFDTWAEQIGRRWGVAGDGLFYSAADPTTPTFHVLPGVDGLGLSRERQATHVRAQYITSQLQFAYVGAVAPGWASPESRIERKVDLTEMGTMTSAKAQASVTNLMSRFGTKEAFTNGLEVRRGMVVDGAGQTVGLAAIRPGLMYRVHGMRDPRNGLPYTDFVAGETVWRTTEDAVQINPIDMVAADF